MKKRHFIIIGLIVLPFLLMGVLSYRTLFSQNSSLPAGEKRAIVIEKGLSVSQIAQKLAMSGIINDPTSFVWSAKILGQSNNLKAGRYEIAGGQSNYDILTRLKLGSVSSIRVTIPEGLDSSQIASILAVQLGADSTRFVQAALDSSFAASLGVMVGSLEGFLFPDTYDFFWEQDEDLILNRMVDRFFGVLPDSIREQFSKDNKSLVEALTMASIIQGEAMVTDEMPVISSVYHNRIQKRMALQADPTLQYIIDGPPRRLTNRDKEIESPYNTYLYRGLPPGPINNPGLDAILAALHPEESPYLYFVANGDGTHTFTRTLNEHLRAKRRFDKIRRDYYRKQNARNGE